MTSVVHEDRHVVFLEALDLDEVVFHVVDIVVTSGEFTLLARVVNPDEYGTFCSVGGAWVVVDEVAGLSDVDET